MNQTTAARVAAFIDGEGCLTRRKWTRKDDTLVVIPVLQVINTAWRLIEWFHKMFEGYVSVIDQRKNWKPAYRWELRGVAAVNLIKACYGWFIVKAQHVRWFVKYKLPQKKPRDYLYNWRISERVQKLNKRGR